MVISETRERFLIALAKEIDPQRIAEIHFFQPIKQGGVESGIAVIATHHAVEQPAPGGGVIAHDADPRFTVHTARYRLVLKGPDRGKWETSVIEEADAPLITVETVVRGVQRRAGDAEDPERVDGDTIREILASVEARRGSPKYSSS